MRTRGRECGGGGGGGALDFVVGKWTPPTPLQFRRSTREGGRGKCREIQARGFFVEFREGPIRVEIISRFRIEVLVALRPPRGVGGKRWCSRIHRPPFPFSLLTLKWKEEEEEEEEPLSHLNILLLPPGGGKEWRRRKEGGTLLEIIFTGLLGDTLYMASPMLEDDFVQSLLAWGRDVGPPPPLLLLSSFLPDSGGASLKRGKRR